MDEVFEKSLEISYLIDLVRQNAEIKLRNHISKTTITKTVPIKIMAKKGTSITDVKSVELTVNRYTLKDIVITNELQQYIEAEKEITLCASLSQKINEFRYYDKFAREVIREKIMLRDEVVLTQALEFQRLYASEEDIRADRIKTKFFHIEIYDEEAREYEENKERMRQKDEKYLKKSQEEARKNHKKNEIC